MTTTDTTALQERIARALYENAEYYGPDPTQPPWDRRDGEERREWMEIAAAVLPIIAATEHRIARLEAQSDIRGRAVVIYRERAREAEARIKAVEDVLDRYAYTGIYTGQERVAVSDIRRALEG